MRYLALLALACGHIEPVEPTARVELTWRSPTCEACVASADVAPSDLVAVRASLNSTLNGWACALDETDAGVSANCTYRCGQPPGTADAGCAWTPCLDGPLVCR